MIINRPGAAFEYDGVKYTIGELVVGTDESEYEGLFGSITEIRDGEDKETENDTPDLYCTFDPPILPHDIKMLEATFSDLYDTPKRLEDICLDEVIMAPSMVEPVRRIEENRKKLQIFVVREEWSLEGERGHREAYYTDYHDARAMFGRMLLEDSESGCISEWSDNEKFRVESGKDFYECWIDGDYVENHCKISICEKKALMTFKTFGSLGRQYVDEGYREDVASQVESWEEYATLTEEQKTAFLQMPGLANRIHKALGRNDCYWECYWQSVSEVAHEAMREYRLLYKQPECFTPEQDNPFPLCVGNGKDECRNCCLYVHMEGEGGYRE